MCVWSGVGGVCRTGKCVCVWSGVGGVCRTGKFVCEVGLEGFVGWENLCV